MGANDNNVRTVYSTGTDGKCPVCGWPRRSCMCSSQKRPSSEPLPTRIDAKLRIEKKGRGGKTVTVVYDLPRNEAFLKELAARLKRECGTGGAVTETGIELQGEMRDRARVMLQRLGYTVGKTRQTIVSLRHLAPEGPYLVVCPASVKRNWAREIEQVTSEPSVVVIEGSAPVEVSATWIIVNYDILGRHRDALEPVASHTGARAIKKVFALLTGKRDERMDPVSKATDPRKRGRLLAFLVEARQALAMAKTSATIDFVKGAIDQGEKVIVFSCFDDPIQKLAGELGTDAVVLTGKTPGATRQNVVDLFQSEGDVRVLLANIIAGGTGLNLTAATQVVFNDLDWVPTNHWQAEDRAYRIGQTRTVNVTYFVAHRRRGLHPCARPFGESAVRIAVEALPYRKHIARGSRVRNRRG